MIREKIIFPGELSAKRINISFLDLPEDTVSSAVFHCCFSTFHPLVFSYISSVRLSLHNLFSCLLIPRLPFPPSLSHGVSSSVLYQPFIIFHAPQIILPSLWLLNDHKMHLCARHLRCSQALRALFFFFHFFFRHPCSGATSSSGERLAKKKTSSLSYHWKWHETF